MSDVEKISKIEAIRQVIADGGAITDYIDVVREVKKRFHLTVSSREVEEIYGNLVGDESRGKADSGKKPKVDPERITLEMTATMPDPSIASSSSSAPKTEQSTQASQDKATEDLAYALKFVRAVGGMKNAQRALTELESMFKTD